jgi:hypothetical protein
MFGICACEGTAQAARQATITAMLVFFIATTPQYLPPYTIARATAKHAHRPPVLLNAQSTPWRQEAKRRLCARNQSPAIF